MVVCTGRERPAHAADDTNRKAFTKLAYRWSIRLAIEGDLRFASHHDGMRAVERVAVRAQLPLTYSQGFNPRPILSLACPRPVAVAARDDVLVLSLDEPVEPDELTSRLNRCAPRGMHFRDPRPLTGKTPPRPRRIRYELPLGDAEQRVSATVKALEGQRTWPVQRLTSGKGRRSRAKTTTTIDARPLVDSMDVDAGRLTFKLRRSENLWARPGEILDLLGLDDRTDLARLVRTAVECDG